MLRGTRLWLCGLVVECYSCCAFDHNAFNPSFAPQGARITLGSFCYTAGALRLVSALLST